MQTCWISLAVNFGPLFLYTNMFKEKSGLPESALDRQVFKIKTDESEYRTRGTGLRQG